MTCPECKGTGKITLLSSVEECTNCKGIPGDKFSWPDGVLILIKDEFGDRIGIWDSVGVHLEKGWEYEMKGNHTLELKLSGQDWYCTFNAEKIFSNARII